MTTVTKVVQAMQTILTQTADQAAQLTRFVQRRSKLSGAAFVQTLVFGWLANPQATLEELAQTAATRGVRISPQGLEQRFTPQATQCLYQVLQAGRASLIAADPVTIPLVDRPIELGQKQRVSCRLIAVRVPESVANQRRGGCSGQRVAKNKP